MYYFSTGSQFTSGNTHCIQIQERQICMYTISQIYQSSSFHNTLQIYNSFIFSLSITNNNMIALTQFKCQEHIHQKYQSQCQISTWPVLWKFISCQVPTATTPQWCNNTWHHSRQRQWLQATQTWDRHLLGTPKTVRSALIYWSQYKCP